MPIKKIILSTMVAGLTFAGLGLSSIVQAESKYPKRPIEIDIAFGPGGSVDRMTRAMAPFLSKELGVPIKVVNRPGAGTQIAANYILHAPADGYHIFASAFAPYLSNTIVSGGAKYKPSDFSFINFQWFEKDLIATNRKSPYKTLDDVVKKIKAHPGKVSVSVVQGSSGHLLAVALPEKLGLKPGSLNVVTYQSGGTARTAIAGNQVDLVMISAKGSEGIRSFIRPLAIMSKGVYKEWPKAVPINWALKPEGITVPIFPGSIRGFAVSAKTKAEHPYRFKILVAAMKKVLVDPKVQATLAKGQIDGIWTGPKKSMEIMNANFKTIQKYQDLLK